MTVRDVIALLSVKGRGLSGGVVVWGGIWLRDMKYVPGINGEPTSLLYRDPPVSVTPLHDGAIVPPLTPPTSTPNPPHGVSHVRKYSHQPAVGTSTNTRLATVEQNQV